MSFHLLQQPWLETLGWTLLHSLWELAAIAAIAFIALFLLRHHAAHVRYAVEYVLLLIMMAMPVMTYAILWTHRPIAMTPVTDVRTMGLRGSVVAATGEIHSTIAPAGLSVSDRILALLHSAPPYAAVIYLAGAAMLILRLLAGHAALRRLRRGAQFVGTQENLLETLRDRLRISVRVEMLHSAQVEVPTVIGAWRPLILLPLTATTGLSTEHVTCLLLHELAHIRRDDFLANLVQSLIETLLFYHPAVMWLSGVIRQEREHCCDDIAAAATGNRARYAAALVSMESLRATPRNLAVAANGGSLLERVQRLVRPAAPRSLSQRIISGSSLLATAVVVAGFACYLAACSRNDTPANSPSASTASAEPTAGSAATTTASSPNRPAQVGDALSISIYELLASGTHYTDIFPVDEKGNVHLPYVGDVPVVGKTPRQIADAIASTAVGKSLLREPQVVVSHTDEIADLRPLKQGDAVFIKVLELETSGKMTDQTAVVDEKGDVPVLHLGRIHVVGLTPTQASARIASTAVDMSVLRPPAYAQVSRFERNWPHIFVESRIMFVDDGVLSPETLPPDGQTKTILLTEKDLKELLERLQRDGASVSVAAPRVTLFDGQTATIAIGREQRSRPTGAFPNSGVEIKITAAVSQDHRSVALTVNSTIKSDAIEKVSPPPSPQALPSSIAVPDKGTILQIGQTIESSDPAKPRKWFILLVRPRIIESKASEDAMFGPSTPARVP